MTGLLHGRPRLPFLWRGCGLNQNSGAFRDDLLYPGKDGAFDRDPDLDSSVAGAFVFGLFAADDPRMVSTMRAVWNGLGNRPPVGGIARHSHDYYHHTTGNYVDYADNTWFVSTLWLADWLTAIGDRKRAKDWIEWCATRAQPSGLLAEQIHPHTGEPLSVSPLTWSHAAFVASVERYMLAFPGKQIQEKEP